MGKSINLCHSIIIFDDVHKNDRDTILEIIDVARNRHNTIYYLIHTLDSINNEALSLFNLFIVFKCRHNLLFKRLWQSVLSDYGNKATIEKAYKSVNKQPFWKFVLNTSQQDLPYFLLSDKDDMHVDASSEFVL